DALVIENFATDLALDQLVDGRTVGRRLQQPVIAAAAEIGRLGPPGLQTRILMLRVVELDPEVVGHPLPAVELPDVHRLGPALSASHRGPDAEALHVALDANAFPP